MHRSQKQVRTFAVKIDGEGWVGVCADAGRCDGHAHPTPELAKLCVLHRVLAPDPDERVVLLPVARSAQRETRSVAR